MPYLATSFSEFWTRLHISLSSWLKEYLYIPLGGSREGEWKTYRNLFLVMALGGIWHGASLNFLVWGIGHGLALIVERKFFDKRSGGLLRWFITQSVVLLLWIFFRSADFGSALWVLQGIFSKNGENSLSYKVTTNFLGVFATCVLGHFLGARYWVKDAFWEKKLQVFAKKTTSLVTTCFLLALGIVVLVLGAGDSESFIYFVF